jgi:predicted CoA-substrate-specific enzyme activase
MIVAGIDIGSTTAKSVILKNGEILGSNLISTGTNPALAGKQVMNLSIKASDCLPSDIKFIVATGYGRVSAPFASKTITEITCHGRGARHVSPDIKTVIDIGGQDAKIISIDDTGRVVDFMMNDKCASGTGRFLESAAQLVLQVPLEELGRLSSGATKTSKISSTCTVFAQTEIISLLAAGESKENIIAGLHNSIASRVGNMVKRVGIKPMVMMTGGVAKNTGVIEALQQELNTPITVPDTLDPQLIGALGAALIAHEILREGKSTEG